MKRYNMMAAKPYTDKQSGQAKTKWVKIGTAVEITGQDGTLKIFGDIESIPTGTWWDGSYNLFEQEQQGQQQHNNNNQQGYQQQQQQQYGQPQQQQTVYNPNNVPTHYEKTP